MSVFISSNSQINVLQDFSLQFYYLIDCSRDMQFDNALVVLPPQKIGSTKSLLELSRRIITAKP